MVCYQAYPFLYWKHVGRSVAAMRALAFDIKKKFKVEKVRIEYPAPGCKVITPLGRVFTVDGTRMRKRPKVIQEAVGFDLL